MRLLRKRLPPARTIILSTLVSFNLILRPERGRRKRIKAVQKYVCISCNLDLNYEALLGVVQVPTIIREHKHRLYLKLAQVYNIIIVHGLH